VLFLGVKNAELLSLITKYINSCQKLSSRIHDITATAGKTPPCKALQNLKVCWRKKTLFYVHLNNVVLTFVEF